MEFKHTPGDWSGRIWHDPVIVASDPSIDLTISFYTGGQKERYQEFLANGRLIVNAPKLLALLMEAFDEPESHALPDSDWHGRVYSVLSNIAGA